MNISRESPYGETPEEDVSCADCGYYRTLYGPLSAKGEVVEHGDMVCETCARKRGYQGEFP